VLYLEGLYVEPDWRRQGIARRLLRSAEAWGLERGCVEMASDAELQNTPGIAFHAAMGFSEANRVVCFIRPITG
jgi:aminoglycoside 6'-N-acetyltransferase I